MPLAACQAAARLPAGDKALPMRLGRCSTAVHANVGVLLARHVRRINRLPVCANLVDMNNPIPHYCILVVHTIARRVFSYWQYARDAARSSTCDTSSSTCVAGALQRAKSSVAVMHGKAARALA